MSEQRIVTKVIAETSSFNQAMEEAAGKVRELGGAAQQQSGPIEGLGRTIEDAAGSARDQSSAWENLSGALDLVSSGAGVLTSALGVLGPAALAAGAAIYQASQESAALSQALIMTGGAAGVTSDELTEMSRAAAAAVGSTRSAASAAAAEAVRAGAAAGRMLQEVTEVALRLDALGIQAVSKTVSQFAELGRDPVDAVIELNRESGFLTQAVYEQIVALEDQGRATEAADLAQKAWADAMKDRATQVEDTIGPLTSMFNTLWEAAKRAWDAVADIGRGNTVKDDIAVLSSRVQKMREARARTEANGGGGLDIFMSDGLDQAERELQALYDKLAAEQKVAAEKAEQVRLGRLSIEWDQAGVALGEKRLSKEDLIKKAREEGLALSKTQEQIATRIAAIEAKFAPKGTTGGKGGDAGAAAAREAAAALREQEKAQRAALKAEQDAIKLAEQGLASMQNQVERQREANAEIGLAGVALAELRAARLEDAAATNEQAAAAAELLGKSPAEIQAYKDKAAALRELATLTREGAGKKEAQEQLAAQEDAALKAAEAWAKESEKIGDSLTDALMRGWEDGKGGLENLRDTAVNMFKTMVLKPLLQPVMGSVAGLLTGFMPGMAGAAGGGGGGGGMGDISSLLSLGNIGNTLSIGSQVLGGTMSLANAAGTMFANATGTGLSGLLATNGAYGTAAGAAGGMGALGAAMPWIGAGLLIASLAFKKKPSNKAAWGDVDLASGAMSDLGNMTGKKQASQETMDARTMLLQALGSFGQDVGATGTVRIDVGGRDGVQAAFNGGVQSFGKDPDAALMGILDEVLKSATIDDKTIAQWQVLKVSLDGSTKSAADMVDVMALLTRDVSMVDIERAALIQQGNESLGQSYARLSEMMGTTLSATEQWRAAQHSLADGFARLGVEMPQTKEGFAELLKGIDITTEAGQTLFRSLANLGPAFLQVANAVEQALQAISDGTDASIRDIEMSVLDDRGRYAYLQNELTAGEVSLREAVDPAEVVRIAEENRATIMSAWQLVPENLRASLSDEFIQLLNDNEALAAERLSVVDPDYDPGAEPERDTAEDSMTAAVTAALESAAEKISQAGDNQLSAAEALAKALGSLRDGAGGGGGMLNLEEPRFA